MYVHLPAEIKQLYRLPTNLEFVVEGRGSLRLGAAGVLVLSKHYGCFEVCLEGRAVHSSVLDVNAQGQLGGRHRGSRGEVVWVPGSTFDRTTEVAYAFCGEDTAFQLLLPCKFVPVTSSGCSFAPPCPPPGACPADGGDLRKHNGGDMRATACGERAGAWACCFASAVLCSICSTATQNAQRRAYHAIPCIANE